MATLANFELCKIKLAEVFQYSSCSLHYFYKLFPLHWMCVSTRIKKGGKAGDRWNM